MPLVLGKDLQKLTNKSRPEYVDDDMASGMKGWLSGDNRIGTGWTIFESYDIHRRHSVSSLQMQSIICLYPFPQDRLAMN